MTRYLIMIVIFSVISIDLSAQTAIPPATGDGTESNPYQIASLENLYWITADDHEVTDPDQETRWASHYVQLNNIDAYPTSEWPGEQGWLPIGNEYIGFYGSYDGQHNSIYGLFINRQETSYIGLFGFLVGATIKNLHVLDVTIRGNTRVGALTGYSMNNSNIINCFTSGLVAGTHRIGGVIGSQYSSNLTNCFSTAEVVGENYIGGLIGLNDSNSSINNCSSKRAVYGIDLVGGLVGSNANSTIKNSYSRSTVTGNRWVGGLVGASINNSSVIDSYSTGYISGNEDFGGLVGRLFSAFIYNSYWDIDSSGQSSSAGGYGRTTEQMTYPYDANTYVEWDFLEVWTIDDEYSFNNGYPYFREETVSIDDEFTVINAPIFITNYPNPFNPQTTIEFILPYQQSIRLDIYNIKGQKINTLYEGIAMSGRNSYIWNSSYTSSREIKSGVYLYQLMTEQEVITRKMILLK